MHTPLANPAPELIRDLPATVVGPTVGHVGHANDVGFTVINYNTAAQTVRCVASLTQCTPPPAWILILDNGSAEPDFDALARGLQGATQSHIQLYRSTSNLGFAAGSNFLINQLLAIPHCDYIGLLNNDAVAQPELVHLLREALTSSAQQAGMSGGRMH